MDFQPLILGQQRVRVGHYVVNRDRHDRLQVSCNSINLPASLLHRLCELRYNDHTNHYDIIVKEKLPGHLATKQIPIVL